MSYIFHHNNRIYLLRLFYFKSQKSVCGSNKFNLLLLIL